MYDPLSFGGNDNDQNKKLTKCQDTLEYLYNLLYTSSGPNYKTIFESLFWS